MSPRLTFGVELEFNIATLSSEVANPVPSDSRPVRGLVPSYLKSELKARNQQEVINRSMKQQIAQKLRDAGLPATVTLDPESKNEALVRSNEPWQEGHWVVTTDSPISSPYDLHDWWPCEVISPPYIFCRESLDAVLLACYVLTSNYRLNVNESCGLHVHVGNGNENFSLDTLRNLFAFLWAFEPVIDSLHPGFRHNGAYFSSLRKSSKLGKGSGLSTLECLGRILMELGRFKLFDLMSDVSPYNVEAVTVRNLKLSPVMGKERETKLTIEFRQHEGTLDGERVINWVKTVVGLLEFAEDCDPVFLTAFVTEYAMLEDSGHGGMYDIVDLLRDIGLDEPATFYEERRHYIIESEIHELLHSHH